MDKIDYSWQNEAKCQGMDINKFYLTHGGKTSSTVAAVCSECPVKQECLSHALNYEEYGYWGGTSPTQRIKLRKSMGIKLISLNIEPVKPEKELSTKKPRRVCGTYSGYKGHRLAAEEACKSCKEANNRYIAELKLRKKEKAVA